MKTIARRFAHNPLFTPADLKPSAPGMEVKCVFNPGAFVYRTRIGLLLRVAESPVKRQGQMAVTVYSPEAGAYQPRFFSMNDPKFVSKDQRGFLYDNHIYSTTISSLLVAWSDDRGRSFTPDYSRRIMPMTELEGYGIEDCRVALIKEVYHLTYSITSEKAIAVGHMTTVDWQSFSERTVMLPPPNKDCCFFPRKINGFYYCLHRPSAGEWGGNSIWLARSPDLKFWGEHCQVASPRPGCWDSERIGPNASPIETPEGWLLLYHGADGKGRYCLGSMLLDLNRPREAIARSPNPIMIPEQSYEISGGFYNNAVFSNGHVVMGDEIIVYYGAADMVTAGVTFLIGDLMNALKPL